MEEKGRGEEGRREGGKEGRRAGREEECPYSGKLSREKTFTNFAVFVAKCESFLREIWGGASFGVAKQAICESFLHENFIFH